MPEDRRSHEGDLQALKGGSCHHVEDEDCTLAEELGHGLDALQVTINELTVEIHEAEERLELLHQHGSWPGQDSLNLVNQHGYTIHVDHVPKVLGLGGVELTFLSVDVEALSKQAADHLPHLFVMVGQVQQVDEDVIKVDQHIDINDVMEEVVDDGLECCQRIGKSKGHDKGLKEAIAHPEGHLPLVTLLNAHQVVCTTEVKLGEDLGAMEAVKGICDQGQGHPVLQGDGVQALVVMARLEGTALLVHEQHGSSSQGLGRTDESFSKVLLNPFT